MTRAVAVDLGTRRIGVAVSDGHASLAFPRPFIGRRGDRDVEHRAIEEVVDEVGADVVVVGLPLSLDGRPGPAARTVLEEVAALEERLAAKGVRVETFDERFTTVSAHRTLASVGRRSAQRRRSVDSASATVLLQAWLEAR